MRYLNVRIANMVSGGYFLFLQFGVLGPFRRVVENQTRKPLDTREESERGRERERERTSGRVRQGGMEGVTEKLPSRHSVLFIHFYADLLKQEHQKRFGRTRYVPFGNPLFRTWMPEVSRNPSLWLGITLRVSRNKYEV